MLSSVFAKSLRDQRRGLVGWAIGIAVLVFAMAALWPSVRDMPDIDEFVQNYPEAMRELFSIDTITTGIGYLNAELFSIILPAMFVVFAVGRGARLLAGEEEGGTLDGLLTTPLSRTRILVEKAAGLVVAVAALGAVLWLVTMVASAALDMGIGADEAAAGAVAMALLGVEYGLVALAVGAATGRRGVATAAGTGLAAAAYVLYVAGQLIESIQPWQIASPVAQALRDGPMGGGFPPAFLLMAAGAAVAIGVAVPIFDRRDIRA